MIFNKGHTIGFYISLHPLVYWGEWLWMYGLFVILLAGLGVYLIIIGYRYKKDQQKINSNFNVKMCISFNFKPNTFFIIYFWINLSENRNNLCYEFI